MLKHGKITLDRVAKYLETRIKKGIHPREIPLTVEALERPGEPACPAQSMAAAGYRPFAVGESWGALWTTTWFRFRGTVPADWQGREVVALVSLNNGGWEGFTCEGLVYRDGRPLTAINVFRKDVPVAASARGGEAVEFFVEAAANGAPPEVNILETSGRKQFVLQQASLAVFDRAVWHLYLDLLLCVETIRALPEDSPRRGQLLAAANSVLNLLPVTDYADLPNDDPAIVECLRAALRPALACHNGTTTHCISAIGHAHIDTAWLWPLREAMRKCARTFSTALQYMEEYPEYIFACSQAVQYDWIKARYPTIWEGIRQAVRRGQWEPVGAMWVEVDCNIPNGESLVRQLLHGKRFFAREFGLDVRNVWIPDVFGYSASMPQIMKQAGIDYFLTQKISWSQFNRFPHHTFEWEGIDGTRIFTHFPPTDTYNGNFTPTEVAQTNKKFLDHDRALRSLYIYGYGDGGGGPTRQMIEMGRRMADCEGLPKVSFEAVREFFPKAKADARDLPVWVGELYLELHRGTYTNQARNKLGNRRSEFLLREAELADALAVIFAPPAELPDLSTMAPPRAVYDVFVKTDGPARGGRAAALDRAWKLTLLNQFHDIIPGSSIGWVYADSANDYATIATLGRQVIEHGWQPILESLDTSVVVQPMVVINALGWPRAEVVDGRPGQPVFVTAPSCGYAVNDLAAGGLPEEMRPVTVAEKDGRYILANGLVEAVIGADGTLTRFTDLAVGREILPPGERGNLLQIHPDMPLNWEAWDVDIYYREVVEVVGGVQNITVVENHPLRCAIQISRQYGHSTFDQTIVLRAGSARLDFVTEADWHERMKFLKVAFPVRIHSPRATYEIQYGTVERPTHLNTSWEMGKFEVCAQKWADLSEGDYGVALLNDCKYGYDIHGHVMRLSLLRASSHPDAESDQGKHRFTYSLFPHRGDHRQGRVLEEANCLNLPLRCIELPRRKGPLPSEQSFLSFNRPGVALEAFKIAEDGRSLIVRFHEAWGTRGPCQVRFAQRAATVQRSNVLEEDGAPLDIRDGTVQLDLNPFEIVTLKVALPSPY